MNLFKGYFGGQGLYPIPTAQTSLTIVSGDAGAVNSETALRHTVVYACNQAVADAMASVTLSLYRRKDNAKEEAKDHPLYNLLKYAPNPYMTSFEWRQMIITDLNLRGRHFSQKIRNGRGEVIGLYPLIADNMQVMLNDRKEIVYLYAIDNDHVPLKAEEVLHIKGLPDSTGLDGINPVEYNRKAIELSKTTEVFGINFFKNGANGSGILQHPQTLSDEAFERLQKSFAEKYQGLANSGKPIILEEGMKYERLSLSNEDSQFLETRKFQKAEIAALFKVPLYMLGDMEKSTFNNMEQMATNFVVNTLMPFAVKIEQAIHRQVLGTDSDLFVKFNLNSLMRGDYKTRTEGYKTLLNIGALNPNEIRSLEGFDPMGKEGDKYYMQLNMATLEQIGKTNVDNKD